MNGKKKRKRLSNQTVGYLYVLPAVIFILLFVVYPIGYNIIISLQKYDIYISKWCERVYWNC